MPNTIGLNAEAVGLQLGERGEIVVDGDCKTNLPGVWAGVTWCVARCWRTRPKKKALPWPSALLASMVTSTSTPSPGSSTPARDRLGGPHRAAAQGRWREVQGGHVPLPGQRRARALGDTTGMVKFLADATTDEILACTSWAPWPSELIAEAVVAMEFKASAEDIARICHAHPSLSEATKEAALAVDKRTLNF